MHYIALVSGLGWHVQDLLRAAGRLAMDLRPVPFPGVSGCIRPGLARVTAAGEDLNACSGVLVRMMPPGSLEQVVFRMDALHRLERAGVPVLNGPRAVETAVDKYLATACLEAAGLPVPPTWAGESASEAIEAFHRLGGDVVIKPLFGSEGRGLVRVSDPELARRAFHALERLGSVLYLQKYVSNEGSDLRLFVVGERLLGAVRRTAAEGDWRTNVSRGGRAEPIRPDPGWSGLALAAARAVGATIAGVDLLLDRSGAPVVLEVNAVPGWRALAAVTRIDVAAEVLATLRSLR